MKNMFFVSFLSVSILSYSQSEFNSKTASIETPEIMVFYEGIPIEINAQAIGYKEVKLSVPNPYIAPPGTAGKSVTVQCTGITLKGKEVTLGSKTFVVKKAPKPELIWNGQSSGSTTTSVGPNLLVRYGDEIPFNASKSNFEVTGYYIVVAGVNGVLEGEGSQISDLHLKALKNLEKGSQVSIQVNVSGVYNGVVDGIFEIQ
jgi:hypothetical protein